MYVSHLKLTWGGPLSSESTGESWTCGLQIGGEGTDSVVAPPPPVEFVALALEVRNFMQRGNTACSLAALTSWVKLAHVGPDGKYLADAQRTDFAPVASTNNTANGVPFQLARVVTLHTGKRGARNRGRFYLPLPIATVDGEGLTSVAQAGQVATSAATFLTALNSSMAGTARVVVASSAGFNSTVTGVTCGRVLDTVRSRRRNLNESYGADVSVAG